MLYWSARSKMLRTTVLEYLTQAKLSSANTTGRSIIFFALPLNKTHLYALSPCRTSTLTNISRHCCRLQHPCLLMSRLRSRNGSNVSETDLQCEHLTENREGVKTKSELAARKRTDLGCGDILRRSDVRRSWL